MGFDDQRIPYPAANDYGPRGRWPTLAVTWHMAEGKNVAQYLARDPLRGVSVHYTVEQATDRWQDGEVVRCLPEDRISGSINPKTIRRDRRPGRLLRRQPCEGGHRQVLAGHEPELPRHQRRGGGLREGGPDRGAAALDGRPVGRAEGPIPEGPSRSAIGTGRTSSPVRAGPRR